MTPERRRAIVSVLLPLLLVVLFALWIRKVELTGPDSNVVTTTSAFVATFVSLLAILLKNSLDRRAELRAEIESSRHAVMAAEAEKRLKLEASIRAVQLLSRPDGVPASDIQCAGALFTLSSLGQHALALPLTAKLLASGNVDSSTAAEILGLAFTTNDPAVQTRAAILLAEYADHFVSDQGADVPRALLEPRPTISRDARFWIPIALGRMLMARPLARWLTDLRYNAYPIMVALTVAWRNEAAPELRGALEAILKEVLDAFPNSGQFHHETGLLVFSEIRAQLQSGSPRGAAADLVENLRRWRSDVEDTTATTA